MDIIHINNFNDHAKKLAKIGLQLINGNKSILEENGVKEIIALYLLIPYITDSTLQVPEPTALHKIPKLEGTFVEEIKLNNLRNAISHSFVTTEEVKDGNKDTYILFDDRILYTRNEHDTIGDPNMFYGIKTEDLTDRIKELLEEVIDS